MLQEKKKQKLSKLRQNKTNRKLGRAMKIVLREKETSAIRES